MFRKVELPTGLPGRLLLHSMPGRHEPLDSVWVEATREGIQTIISLAEAKEIRTKSPSYACAIESGSVPCEIRMFEVPDFGVPADRPAFHTFVDKVAQDLRAGRVVLVHCAGGVGRTGMFATCLLMALGISASRAQKAVSSAGSAPETEEQRSLISSYASQLRPR